VNVAGWLQIAVVVLALSALTPVLAAYMARVYSGERTVLSAALGPTERLVYRAGRQASEKFPGRNRRVVASWEETLGLQRTLGGAVGDVRLGTK
jgi:hypothetical protein